MTEGTRPEGGYEPPSGGGGEWLPPVAPGPPPGAPPPTAPPGWRISPKATELDPDAPSGPEPWADPGNSVAAPGLGLSVAACGLLFYGLAVFALPIAIAGSILSGIGYRRLKQGETRKGRVESSVGVAVGIGTALIAVAVIAVLIATR